MSEKEERGKVQIMKESIRKTEIVRERERKKSEESKTEVRTDRGRTKEVLCTKSVGVCPHSISLMSTVAQIQNY